MLTIQLSHMCMLAAICVRDAVKYAVSQLMIYKCKRACPLDPGILINIVKVPRFKLFILALSFMTMPIKLQHVDVWMILIGNVIFPC